MSSTLQKLRIIAIPLTRPNTSRPLLQFQAQRTRLVYYQFQITVPRLKQPPPTRLGDGDQGSETASAKKGWLPEEGITKWATNKVADIWAGFGRSKGGWKLKVYQAGEQMVDRMEFEELALKSIDLSMNPSAAQFRSSPLTISLVFPSSILSSPEVLSSLRGYAGHRISKHRKGFYLWMIIAPMMAPFMIVPVIPNLPFFFCVWRSWSHYRAYRSSQYLQSLLDHDVIVPEASKALDEVYNLYPPPTPSSLSSHRHSISESNSSGPSSSSIPNTEWEPQHKLLLGPEAIPAILSLFELESTTSTDLHRAVEQARLRVLSGHIDP